jgi:hypothetical protein
LDEARQDRFAKQQAYAAIRTFRGGWGQRA